MDGQKDDATLKYEREIRIGVALLGILALAFLGVLARRIWMENSQASASVKKPIYLSRAERDALRIRNKPLPLYSINRSNPSSAPRETTVAKASGVAGDADENKVETIPDLQIEEEPQAAKTASFNEEVKTPPAVFPKPPARLKPREDAAPITPRKEVETASPLNEESTFPPFPSDQAATQPGEEESNENASEDEGETTLEERPSPLLEPSKMEPSKMEPSKMEPAKMEPAKMEPAKMEPAKMEPATNETAPAPATEDSRSISAEPKGEVIRKKAEQNPWKKKSAADAVAAAAPTKVGSAPGATVARYTVSRSDSLKTIARKLLGEESRWKEIYDLNREEIGDDFSHLRVGLKLQLPQQQDEPPQHGEGESKDLKVGSPQ